MVKIDGSSGGTLATSLFREKEQLAHSILGQRDLFEICVLCQIRKPYRLKYVIPKQIRYQG